MKNEKITDRNIDFAKWYSDVISAARLARYSSVKGCIVFEPNGYAIWENIKNNLDKMLKETGHKNVQLPLLIPENLMNKESELIKGFSPEVAWVTHGGDKLLEERLCIRPTSETLFSDYYSEVVKSYKDLPLKYNQWCNVMRWEKETRPFLRGREFFWQEGHTVHSTQEEAEKETKDILEIYKKFFKEYLAIPVLSGKKTEKEKFAGAEYSLTIEALMYNGICLQSGTSHYFGQKFSKAYNIKFLNKDNNYEYAYQTSWGVTSRMIGAVIMVHGDNLGLVLPPKIAPIEVSIVGIGDVLNKTKEVYELLKQNKIRVHLFEDDKSFGYKLAESEVNGIPLRIEIGKRDLLKGFYTITRRDTLEKIQVYEKDNLIDIVNNLLEKIQIDMYNKALKRMEENTYIAKNTEEIKEIINKHPGFIKTDWCGRKECEDKLKEINGLKSRCILENEKPITGKCAVCGKKADKVVVWGIQY